MSTQFNQVQDIFSAVGGAAKLGIRYEIHQYTIERWQKTGIPMKYWEDLYKLCGVTPAECYRITMKIKNRK